MHVRDGASKTLGVFLIPKNRESPAKRDLADKLSHSPNWPSCAHQIPGTSGGLSISCLVWGSDGHSSACKRDYRAGVTADADERRR
jgi:hypothetical protein